MKCNVKVDGYWHEAVLSKLDIEMIQMDIEGLFQASHNIVISNGDLVDTGIIDGLEIIS